MNPMESKCTIIPAGEGPTYWIVGDRITFKLGADETAGRFAFAETTVAPGGGPPPHIHGREDEMFYILEGEFTFTLGDSTITAKPGDAFYLHKGIVHTFKNVGSTTGRVLVAATPCGFEDFVREAGYPLTDPTAPPPPVNDIAIGRLMGACARHGLNMRFDHPIGAPTASTTLDTELWVLTNHIRIKLTTEKTAGNFTMAEITSPPGAGVPPHTHLALDEVFYVLKGTFEFELDGRTLLAPRGTFIHIPPNALHGFRNVSEKPATLLDFHSPGGFENFFKECGTLCTDRTNPPPPPTPADFPRIAQLMEKHGMTLPTPAAS